MSGEKIPYHLRQNKFVDRALFLESLSHINRYPPARISDYLYVSFGGAYLEDFKIIHSTFGNTKMLSLEELDWVHKRQQFNIPYGCVECTRWTSEQFIKDYSDILASYGSPNVLVWLDYASAKQLRSQLTEYEALLPKLKRLDVVKITLNAHPASLDGTEDVVDDTAAEEKRAKRLTILRDRIGDYLPSTISPDDLRTSRYPEILLYAVWKAAANGLAGSPHLHLHPIAAYSYQDTHQMITITAVILGEQEVETFKQQSGLGDFEFATNNWESVIKIDIPHLSAREKLYLDTLVRKRTAKKDLRRLSPTAKLKVTLAGSHDETRHRAETYLRFHRYYPHYHRIHY